MVPPHPSHKVRRRLLTADGVRIEAVLTDQSHRDPADVGIVVAHGFSASMDKRFNRRIIDALSHRLPVIAFDFRGHGRSDGQCTLGEREIQDVAAAVAWARTLQWKRVVTLGFSMGAAVVLRHAGELGGVDAVAAVSGPAFWNYRGTPVMRRLHFGVENRLGRVFVRRAMRTRVVPPPWPTPWPTSPVEAAGQIPPVPLLIVHGQQDPFFPDEHPRALVRSARSGAARRGLTRYEPQFWLSDFGHAEAAIPREVLDGIVDWVVNGADGGATAGRPSR